jgi:phosphate transport system substrate-binding protein
MRLAGGLALLLAAAASAEEVTVIGYNDMRECLTVLNGAFTARHPDVHFTMILEGTRTAPAALADRRSAFAPMGAEFSDQELAAYRKITGNEPILFKVAHDSLNPAALSAPLAIFAHKDNPLDGLSLEQAERIFTEGSDIHVVGVNADAALGLFLRKHIFHDRPFVASMTGFAQSAEVVAAVGKDRNAIGFAAANRITPEVKILAVDGLTPGQEGYPLDRTLYIYARRPLEPLARDYLDLVLSPEGQRLIAQGSLGYRPLNSAELAAERANLGEHR